jgi:DNA-binding NarL/FixJ family response regulator
MRHEGPTTICIIEDHPVLCEGLSLLLSHHGFEVLGTACTAAEGFDLVQRTDPDVVIVDLLLTDEHGTALVRRLLCEQPDLRAVVYTGLERAADVAPALSCGAQGVVSKASPPEEFRAAIRAVADGGNYLDERIRKLLAEPRGDGKQLLSKREREVLSMLAAGLTLEQIASMLVLSPETVRTHVRNAGRRLGGRTRVHTIALALQGGEIWT